MRLPLLAAALLAPAVAAAQVTPGRWDMVTTIQTMEMPGMPAALAAMAKARAIKTRHCLTPDQAKLGPQEAMKSDNSCRFDRYSAAAGRIDAVMVCTRGGQTMTTTSTGSFTADGFTATGTTIGSGERAMKITTTTIGKRSGDCS